MQESTRKSESIMLMNVISMLAVQIIAFGLLAQIDIGNRRI